MREVSLGTGSHSCQPRLETYTLAAVHSSETVSRIIWKSRMSLTSKINDLLSPVNVHLSRASSFRKLIEQLDQAQAELKNTRAAIEKHDSLLRKNREDDAALRLSQ